jgi:hypothetical protein
VLGVLVRLDQFVKLPVALFGLFLKQLPIRLQFLIEGGGHLSTYFYLQRQFRFSRFLAPASNCP